MYVQYLILILIHLLVLEPMKMDTENLNTTTTIIQLMASFIIDQCRLV